MSKFVKGFLAGAVVSGLLDLYAIKKRFGHF